MEDRVLYTSDLDQFLNRDTISQGINITQSNSDAIFSSGSINASKIRNLEVGTLVIDKDGFIRSGKTAFDDVVNSGWYLSAQGIYIGSAGDLTYLKYDVSTGTFQFNGDHIAGTIGTVPISDIVNIGTPTPDAIPSGLAVSDTGLTISNGMVSAYITLTWDAITSDTFRNYKIRYKKNAFTFYNYIDTNETTITIDGLTPNTLYNFAIASVNKHGNLSTYSSTVNGTTPVNDTPPAKVAGVSALGGIQLAIVEWDANTESDLSFYEVYRNDTNNSATSSKIADVNGTTFVNGNLTGGQTYYYWIKAVNTSGYDSEFSDVASATPRNVASADNQISNIGWVQDCEFSSVDNETVAWTSGTFKTSAETEYNILAGNTGAMAARTYIYLDIIESTTEYQTTTTATNAVGDNKVLVAVAQNVIDATKEAIFQVFGGAGGQNQLVDTGNIVQGAITSLEIAANTIEAGNIKANTITSSEIAAETITSNEIAANTIEAGNIKAGTITSTEIDTNTITSDNILSIGADKVLIQGTTYFSDFLGDDGGITKIDGANIVTGSVTANELNFTPTDNSNIIGTINASTEEDGEEALKISADKLIIDGKSYFTSEGGARVEINTGDNIGLKVVDDDDNEVFKTIIGGDDVGDVYIGNYAANQGMFYDKDNNQFNIKGVVTITGGSGYNNLTDKPTLGSLAAKNTIGTTDVDTTIISGGKIVTGLLTADSIQTGTLSVSSTDTAIHVKSGGNINIDGLSDNSGKIVWRDASDVTKKWNLFMETGASEEWLVLKPENLIYRDIWLGRYDFSQPTDEGKTSTAIRNFFIKTGNDLSGASRPSISFQNWNAYGGYFSLVNIGNSDSESIVQIRGNTKPTDDNEFNLGSEGTNNNFGWKRLYIGNQGDGSKYFYGTTVTEDTSGMPSREASATNVRFLCSAVHTPVGGYFQVGLSKYQPITINYKDHNNVNRQINVLGKVF